MPAVLRGFSEGSDAVFVMDPLCVIYWVCQASAGELRFFSTLVWYGLFVSPFCLLCANAAECVRLSVWFLQDCSARYAWLLHCGVDLHVPP